MYLTRSTLAPPQLVNRETRARGEAFFATASEHNYPLSHTAKLTFLTDLGIGSNACTQQVERLARRPLRQRYYAEFYRRADEEEPNRATEHPGVGDVSTRRCQQVD